MIHELSLQITVCILPQSSPPPILSNSILSLQRSSPITSLGYKMLSLNLAFCFFCFVLHFSYILWKESQPGRVKVGSLHFFLKSFIALIFSVKWITTLTEFSSLYHPKMLHFQRKYLKMYMLKYPNIIYCTGFCFREFCLHVGIGVN